jgi:hypothetical protein
VVGEILISYSVERSRVQLQTRVASVKMDPCKSIGLCVGGTLIKLVPFKLKYSTVLLADLSDCVFPSDGHSLRVYMRNSEEYRICHFSCGQQKISLVGKDIVFSGFRRRVGEEVKDFKVKMASEVETNNVISIEIHSVLDKLAGGARQGEGMDTVDGSLVCYDTDKPSDIKYTTTYRFEEWKLLARVYIILHKPTDDVRYFH